MSPADWVLTPLSRRRILKTSPAPVFTVKKFASADSPKLAAGAGATVGPPCAARAVADATAAAEVLAPQANAATRVRTEVASEGCRKIMRSRPGGSEGA